MSVLALDNVSISFGGLTALNGVTFSVEEREIVAVIGPNGAGKTTLFNVITGVYEPTSGRVLFNGIPFVKHLSAPRMVMALGSGVIVALLFLILWNVQSIWDAAISSHYLFGEPFPWSTALADGIAVVRDAELTDSLLPFSIAFFIATLSTAVVSYRAQRSPEIISRAGVARTFQNIRLFNDSTVIDNVLVGMNRRSSSSFIDALFRLPRFAADRERMMSEGFDILTLVGLRDHAFSRAGSLPYGSQRRLEIARALATKPTLLLLDEPAAGMNPTEAASLVELIREIRDRGITVLLIEHHMDVVMGISDRIVVLDYGNPIAQGSPEEIRTNRRVIEAYLGPQFGAHP